MRPAPAAALAAAGAAARAAAPRASAAPPPPRLVRTVRSLPSTSRALALTPDGTTAFVVAPLFGQVWRVRLADGVVEAAPPRVEAPDDDGGDSDGPGARLRSIGATAAATPDGATVFVTGDASGGPLFVFDGRSCALAGALRVAAGADAVALSADGASLFVGCAGDVAVLDAADVAAATRRGDAAAPKPRAVLRSEGQLLRAAALAVSGRGALAALCTTGRWALWRAPLRAGPPDAADGMPCGAARALALAADGRALAAGGSDDRRFGTYDGVVCRWVLPAGTPERCNADAAPEAEPELEGWEGPGACSEAAPAAPSVLRHAEVRALAMSADGRRVFVANACGLAAEWRPGADEPAPLEMPREDAARESWREPPPVLALALDAAGRTLVGLREAENSAELLIWAL